MALAHDLEEEGGRVPRGVLERAVERVAEAAERLHAEHREGDLPEPAAPRYPDAERLVRLIGKLRRVLFPGHYSGRQAVRLDVTALNERLGDIFWDLADEIHSARPHACDTSGSVCPEMGWAQEVAAEFIARLPDIRATLCGDVRAAYDGDPAAKSYDEILLAYPGFFAVLVYRLAHELWRLGVPLIPRMMTEHAHSVTGIDIHPGARIGRNFFIDHGTGVVIGETAVIGDHVKLYQGVTIGALSFPKDEHGELIRNQKRHPTLEDDVVVYSGATILGGSTVVGRGAVIGGNCWVTESVPAGAMVLHRPTVELRPPHGAAQPARGERSWTGSAS
ncbi:MAG: serine acetyltransferase [Bacillota bacterium]|nr:serine acetyltransferase [Bacillota bacterium]